MDENKNIQNNEEAAVNDTVKDTENTASETPDNNKTKKADKKAAKKAKKAAKPKKLKNKALFKRGGYAIAITAAVLAGIIVFNVLVSALSDRFNLKFDMSSEKTNSISEENLDFIKSVDTPVTVTVCADENQYTGGYMAYYAQNYYNATGDNAADYYKQTIKLINQYNGYNNKISINFVDPQDTKFTEISSKYPNDKLYYGDIIVSATVTSKDGTESERYKVVGFKDIYTLSDDSGYASYGYSSYNVTGNNIETSLTSAISYVTSSVAKKVALLTGHSNANYYDKYVTTLKNNNYNVEIISDALINSVSSDYDAVVIVGPTTDFIGSELDAISEFLDNDGQLNKGLIYFADATAPNLPNLYDFLSQWGIEVQQGILFETNSSSHIADDPTTMGVYAGKDDITDGMTYCITGYNVPVKAAFETQGSITVTPLMSTSNTVVNAPVGTGKDWTGADSYAKDTYAGVIQAKKAEYNSDNEAISSYVMLFGSIEYIYSDWTEYPSIFNKNISLAAAERAVGAEDTGISFVSKTITNESFSDSVTAAGTNTVRIIFMILLPLLTIAAGIYIFIRRKNA